jgi:arylsulfatase A-like enzyme
MPQKPNIIFILADDMGIGDLGCYNPESKIPTPNMDRLAAEGIRFTDAHSSSAVCTPSRYGILTGRYCWRAALPRRVLLGYEPPLIEPTRLTVARMLQKRGYDTACIGKWHLGLGYQTLRPGTIDFARPLPWPNADRAMEENIDFSAPLSGGPLELGFDRFFGTSGCSTCQPPYAFIDGDRFPEPPSDYRQEAVITGRPGMASPSWRHEDADPEFARQAVQYIEERASAAADRAPGSVDPFFLYLAASAPHEPCIEAVVPEFARGKSAAGPRGDLVWLFDWMVGQVLDTLDRTGLARNTLIFVSSDNGALPGDRVQDEHGNWAYATYNHRPSMGWRGWKAHIWEGGHREPLLARWPDRIAPGTCSDQLCCLGDFTATCADLVGEQLPEDAGEDSVSLLPILTGAPENGQPVEPIRRDVIHHSSLGVFSIRRDNWKLVLETKGSGGWPPPQGEEPEPGAPGQLYDLEADPGEQEDLFEKRDDVVAELTGLIEGYRQSTRSVRSE